MNQNSRGSSIEPINRIGSRKPHLALSRFAAGLFGAIAAYCALRYFATLSPTCELAAHQLTPQ